MKTVYTIHGRTRVETTEAKAAYNARKLGCKVTAEVKQ